jgi:hypothetical protein
LGQDIASVGKQHHGFANNGTEEGHNERLTKQGETAMRPDWPEDKVFRRLVLDNWLGGKARQRVTKERTMASTCRQLFRRTRRPPWNPWDR